MRTSVSWAVLAAWAPVLLLSELGCNGTGGPPIGPGPGNDNDEADPLVVSASADPDTIEAGQSAVLSASVGGGTPPFAFAWSAAGWEGSSEESPTVTPAESTEFRVEVTDSSDPPRTAFAVVAVTVTHPDGEPGPLMVSASADRSPIAPGESTTLRASASGGVPPYSYQWFAASWEGSVEPVVEVTPAATTVYTLEVSDTADPPATVRVTVVVTVSPEAPARPRVRLSTNMGDIVVELFDDDAPVTVANFLAYVDEGFYDGQDEQGPTIFHRVVAGFVIQGGGLTEELEPKTTRGAIVNEASNRLSNQRGTIAMARTNDPDSATSQFFINVVDNAFLDFSESSAGYAVFGQVVEGLDVVDAIAAVETTDVPPYADVPVTPIVIEAAQREAAP